MFRQSGISDRNIREFVSENAELKKFHEQMRRDVQNILGRHEGIPGRGAAEDSTGVNKRVGVGRSRPTRVGEGGYIGSLKKQWNSLKQLVEILEARASQFNVTHVISVTDHEKELTRLKKEMEELQEELEQSRELIGHQQQLLQDQMVPQPGEGQSSPLWDAYFLEEQLRLQQDRAAFEEQRMAFQDEREKFTEAAIRLGRERLQFKADQALFMKQQFLNMTPGLGTPPWKKTPPWSALDADTPTRTSSNPKQPFTPSRSCTSRLQRGLTSCDPTTPSTAELYRVLRLVPPSRSAGSHTCESSSLQDTDSEDSSRRWSDSLSPRSESPELQPLPQFVAPLKMSLTPYLRPRPTPVSLPRSHMEPRTPSTAELFRALRLTPADSVCSGQKRHGDVLRRSILHHSHRRASISKVVGSHCCNEAVRNSEQVPECPHELVAADYETDSLQSEDSTQTLEETPTSEKLSLPRENSESFENDSLYRVTPLGDHVPQVRVDSRYCNQSAGSICHSMADQDLCPCEEQSEKLTTRLHPNGILRSRPKESLHSEEQCSSRSRETLHPRDTCRLSENPCPREGYRSRSRERPRSRDRCRTRSREDVHRRDSTCDQRRASLHFEVGCADKKNELPHHSNTKRRRSLESLHHTRGCRSHQRESCGSHSVHRRSSRHQHRDSLYTSGPGRSPLHFRSSCSSVHNAGPWTSEQVAASNLCTELLNQFLDCSY